MRKISNYETNTIEVNKNIRMRVNYNKLKIRQDKREILRVNGIICVESGIEALQKLVGRNLRRIKLYY